MADLDVFFADMGSVLMKHLRAKYGDTSKSVSMRSGGFAQAAKWLHELAIQSSQPCTLTAH